jgi:hypothetical protein
MKTTQQPDTKVIAFPVRVWAELTNVLSADSGRKLESLRLYQVISFEILQAALMAGVEVDDVVFFGTPLPIGLTTQELEWIRTELLFSENETQPVQSLLEAFNRLLGPAA